MPTHVLIVDIAGIALAGLGFTMAFRQEFVRRLIGRDGVSAHPAPHSHDDGQDPLTYALRIAGMMIMVFGIVLAGMMTLFNLR